MTLLAHTLAGLFLLFLVLMHLGYLALHVLALRPLRRTVSVRALQDLPPAYSGYEPPVSLLVPAFDQAATIVETVRGLLELDYPEYEIVVVNDGSADATLAALQQAFDLEPFPEVYWRRLATKPIRTIYRSRAQPRVRVVDKETGGRADALNAGINAARYPLFCALDAQALIHRDSLRRAAEPFLDDPATVASGAAIRLANGCTIAGNRVTGVALPRATLGLLQVAEYLRTYPFARLGWAELRGALVMSGAMAVFRKDAVVEAGGFKPQALGATTELMMRLHRLLHGRAETCSVHFVPDAVGWSVAPETFAELKRQHMRRQWGLAESLHVNADLFGSRSRAGLVAFPFLLFFECYGPLLEIAGYLLMVALFAAGWMSGALLLALLAAAFSLGLLVSMSALLLEEYTFRLYPRADQLARLILAAVIENLGYRQLVAWWRCAGFMQWARARLAATAPEVRVLPGHDRRRM